MTRLYRILLFTLLLVAPTLAQDDVDDTPRAPKPCSEPEARQFDFWLGKWDVYVKGKVVGHNRVTPIHGKCTIFEDYGAAHGGPKGQSFNYYDASDGQWHQVWVDDTGLRLHLRGGFADDRMIMSGERKADGELITDRITWIDNRDGTVQQIWDVSKDGGVTWNTVFDGLYRDPSKNKEEDYW